MPTGEHGIHALAAPFARAGLLVSTVALPVGITVALVDSWTGVAVLLGAAATLSGALAAGRDAARSASPVLVVGGALGSAVLGTVWWVVLVTVLAAVAGQASTRRAMPAFSVAALAAVVAPGPATSGQALVYAVGLALGTAYGLLLAGRLELPAPTVDLDLPAVAVATILGTTAGLAAGVPTGSP